jgi:ABC-type amino acid transport substrate-binding protein
MKRSLHFFIIMILLALWMSCSGSSQADKADPGLQTSASDQSWEKIKKSGVLVIGMDTSELPWVELDAESGKYEGFEYELMEKITQELGMKLKIISTHWVNLANTLIEKKFDILANAYSEKDVEEPEKFIWSEPYYEWVWVVCARSNDKRINTLADLKGKIVGCYIDSQELCSTIPGIKELKVYDQPAYDKLLEGVIDVFIYDSTSVYYVVRNEPRLKVVGPIFPENVNTYRLGFRKEDVSLKDTVNNVLTKILAGEEYKAILAKWR